MWVQVSITICAVLFVQNVILTNWDFGLFTQNDSYHQHKTPDICGSADPVVLQVIDPALVHSSHYWIQLVIQFCGSFCDKPEFVFGQIHWA
jgi:hypothetical protein